MRTGLIVLFALVTLANVGCRACCGTCQDYASPVANCQCQSCGGSGRAGSAMPGSMMTAQKGGGEQAAAVAEQPAVKK
jgi:hypothetical protein